MDKELYDPLDDCMLIFFFWVFRKEDSWLGMEAPLGDLGGYDIKSLYLNILKSSGKRSPSKESEEVMKWISFAEIFPVDSSACFDALNGLNEVLALNSVLLGNGLTPSEADIIVFSVIHSSVIGLSHLEMEKLVHVMRWMDYIQSKVDFGKLFEKVLLKKDAFEFQDIRKS
ncbi:aminoacyl tRNA synthase complex-interacting multifunctional protein [Salix suchowensis]|nr:aminoacyl tRNA synthase complex-interacting multifunctional protein [Salix suchowensis]